MSAPSTAIAPSSTLAKPAIIIKVVVLPEPDGPSSEKNSPGWMARLTSSTTRSAPYRLVTPRRSIAPLRLPEGVRKFMPCGD
jgi:hypothetical protein